MLQRDNKSVIKRRRRRRPLVVDPPRLLLPRLLLPRLLPPLRLLCQQCSGRETKAVAAAAVVVETTTKRKRRVGSWRCRREKEIVVVVVAQTKERRRVVAVEMDWPHSFLSGVAEKIGEEEIVVVYKRTEKTKQKNKDKNRKTRESYERETLHPHSGYPSTFKHFTEGTADAVQKMYNNNTRGLVYIIYRLMTRYLQNCTLSQLDL